MKETLSSSAERLTMLETRMSASDVRCLQESSEQVRRFVAVGGALGFFERSSDSPKVGYDVPRHVLLPEAPLASLVHSDTGREELFLFVERWQAEAKCDPVKFIERLISESERLGIQYETRTDRIGTLGIEFAQERLAQNSAGKDVAALHAILEDCAPPDEELPAWFQVMRRHQLMPPDIKEILNWKPKEDARDSDITGGSDEIRLHIKGALS